METTLYITTEKSNAKGKSTPKPQKIYQNTAVLSLQIVLAALDTLSNVSDTVMLPKMLTNIMRYELNFAERFFNADKYDENYELLFWLDMILDIKQRNDAANRNKPYRR